jgi:hypothetical protein
MENKKQSIQSKINSQKFSKKCQKLRKIFFKISIFSEILFWAHLGTQMSYGAKIHQIE